MSPQRCCAASRLLPFLLCWVNKTQATLTRSFVRDFHNQWRQLPAAPLVNVKLQWFLSASASGTESRIRSSCGQMLDGKPVGFAADLWAFGCVVYQLLHGKPPFKAASEYLTFQKVTAGEYQIAEEVPQEARDLISRLLSREPSERLGEPFVCKHSPKRREIGSFPVMGRRSSERDCRQPLQVPS